MNSTPLDNLRDIHLPETIGFWPPAYGWWILFFIAIGLGILIYYYSKKYIRKTAYRKQGLRKFNEINMNFQQHKDPKLWLNDISKLLKSICILAYPKASFAELYGYDWLKFLDSKITDKSNKSLNLFTQADIVEAYNQQFKPDLININKETENNIITSVTTWIKNHQ